MAKSGKPRAPRDILLWKEGVPWKVMHGVKGHPVNDWYLDSGEPCATCYMREWNMAYIEDVFPKVVEKVSHLA